MSAEIMIVILGVSLSLALIVVACLDPQDEALAEND